VRIIGAAVAAATQPLGETCDLVGVLRDAPASMAPPDDQPPLVLMLAELSPADAVINAPDQPALADQAPVDSGLMICARKPK
jgi:hypothetical protein